MSELTVSQIKERIKYAEEEIFQVLKTLEEITGLPLDNIDLRDKWFTEDDPDDESLARSYRVIEGIKIDLDFNA